MIDSEVRRIAEEYLENVRSDGSENISASCPFHVTDNPRGYSRTFGMSLTRGVWNCFSCKESGNLYTFLRKMQVGARAMKRNYGALLDELRKQQPSDKKKKAVRIQTIPEHILGAFDYCPEELLEAGFEQNTLKKFDVGYDRERNRVTYPVRTINGDLVGIIGKREDDKRKYMPYTQELEQYSVSVKPPPIGRLLWNAHRVLPEVLLSPFIEPVILVEGYKACMWVHQAGYTRVVHPFGSGLTDEQAELLQELGTEAVIMFDGDKAGMYGTIKAGNKLRSSMLVRVAQLMETHQPDDLAVEDIEEVIDCSESFEIWKHSKGTTEQWRLKKLQKKWRSER